MSESTGASSMSADAQTSASAWSVAIDGEVLSLSGALDFNTARQILEKVQAKLVQGGPGIIDLGGVNSTNSAGLAVMVEWLSVARREGHEIKFRNVPSGLKELAKVCQVDELLPIA